MDRRTNLSVGFLMLGGILCLVYLSVSFGKIDILRPKGYVVHAAFPNVTGLKENTAVELLGIRVGTVKAIELKDYKARVRMVIDKNVDLPEDSIASIRTRGLLGEQYVSISPGGLPDNISKDGAGEIQNTQPPLIMEEMIGKLMFGNAEKKSNAP